MIVHNLSYLKKDFEFFVESNAFANLKTVDI